MKKILILLCCAICLSVTAQTKQADMDEFVGQLMQKMTLREKLGQINQLSADEIQTGVPQEGTSVGKAIAAGEVGSVFNVRGVDHIRELQRLAVEQTRLGIPLLVGMDVIHGYETLFPIPLGMASTWDMPGVERSAQIAAREMTANGIAWTFSPMVDICVDARWGRAAEGAGEDPLLGSRVAQAMVRGYQGPDLQTDESAMACIKHFALYGAAEAGLDYNFVDMSRQRMYNQYFPPYRAAVEAGAGSVMTSYNLIEYVPASANRWLLTDVLRKEWGFQGMVVTDYGTITDMEVFGLGTRKENAARALRAGVDMDMVSKSFLTTLEKSLEEGRVSMDDIDRACRRVLEAKYRLGLFQNPYKYLDEKRAKKETYTKEHRQVARHLTAESFVLLKNDKSLLPLEKKGTIALIGPLAESRSDMAGCWSMAKADDKYSTLREGLERALKGKAKVLTAQGCNFLDNEQVQNAIADGHQMRRIPRVNEDDANREALQIASEADVIVCAMGEMAWMSGEGASRADISLPAPQRRLLEKLVATGKPVILLNFAGRATALEWESKHCTAIMNVWYGSECADAVADVLFGDEAPGGRLPVSMPRVTGQEPFYYNHVTASREQRYDDHNYHPWSATRVETGNGALYPFGFGLTYTQFAYSPVHLSATEMQADGSLTATVTVTNIGKREGSEVVQLYLRDVSCMQARPLRELKDFQRLILKPGESREVQFVITPQMLSYYNAELHSVADPGDFDLYIGSDSRTENKARFRLQ